MLVANGQGDIAVTHMPALAPRKGIAHDIGPQGSPNPPHAVEPAHMPAGIMEGYIIIQGRIHAARSQAKGQRPEAKGPEGIAGGKAKKAQGRQEYAEGRHLPRAKAPGKPVAQKAGKDGAAGAEHGKDPRIGNGHGKPLVHGGPGRPQDGIRQPQADESQIDDNQQKLKHSRFS